MYCSIYQKVFETTGIYKYGLILRFLLRLLAQIPHSVFALSDRHLGRFFFRMTKTFCKHCALTISDIVMRFSSTNGERNRQKNVRDRFLNFVTWSAEESDKV